MITFAAKNTTTISMRRYLSCVCVLLSTVLFLASCLGSDEDDTVLYDDTAITSFYISTAKMTKHTTSSTGADSTYFYTNSNMSEYPFSIDQLNGLIYNVDSLPIGTDVTKLLVSFSTKNNGLAYIENLAGDSLKALSTTDSIDFSSPRRLRVYSSDVSACRTYVVTVNVHKETADSFKWAHVADNEEIAALTGVKAVYAKGRIMLFGSNGTSTSVFSTTDGVEWAKGEAVLGNTAYENVAVKGDTIYILDNGVMKVSADGETFADRNATNGLQKLLGGSMAELYALGDDGLLMVSADNGWTWAADGIDEEAALLPATDIAFHCAPSNYADSTDYVLLAGSRSIDDYPSDGNAVVWSKVAEYANGSEEGEWTYMNVDDASGFPLPRLSNLRIVGYGGKMLALGQSGIGGCRYEPFSNFYESRDGGITWKRNASYALPELFDRWVPAFDMVVDGSNNIWVFCCGSGQVWRGLQNDMAWEK